MGEGCEDQLAEDEYGFVRAKRREEALLVQMCMTYKLNEMGKSHVRCLYDATNAFASTFHESLAQHADAGLGEQEAELMNNRRVNAQVWLDTPTGELIAVPGRGALMGDSRAPVDFRKAYRPGLAKWREKLEQAWGSEDTKATLAICMGGDEQADPSDMQKVDIGRIVFADDLARTQVARSPAAALEFIGKADQILGECLGEQGHSQKSSKKVIMPHSKKRSDRWHFASLEGGLAGKVSINARYLGSTLSIFQFTRPEREKRVQAVRAAWASLGKFWAIDAPEKQKRLVSMGQVMGSAVSDLVAFVLRPED